MSANISSTANRPPHTPFWSYIDFLNIITISVAVGSALWRFWAPGIASSADMLMGVYRVFELAQAWHYGILYPRLGPDLNFGYGAPLFQFYPPLASYVGLLFHASGLGFIGASKATATLALWLAGIGMYGYARQLLQNRCAALASALFYACAPYLLLDIYERGAIAEVLALLCLPWLFWALQRLLTHARALGFAAGWLAVLMLAHNITAFWAFPVAGLYFGSLALAQRRWTPLLRLVYAFGLGLGLSAFYWLPALLEVKFTQASIYMLQTPAEFAKNLVHWSELVQPTWLAQYQGPLRFHFGLLQASIALFGLLALPWYPAPVRSRLIGLAILLGVSLCLQLEFTQPVWLNVPLMRFIQFPWRLLGLAAFCTALLGGALLSKLPLRERYLWPLTLILCALFVSFNIQHLDPTQLPFWYEIDENGINLPDLFARGARGYALFSDYTPLDLKVSSETLSKPRAEMSNLAPPLGVAPSLQVLTENPFYLRLAVEAPAAFAWRLSRIFFPGWQIYVNDQPVPTTASGPFGLVTAQLPAGNYTLTARFGQTTLRKVADAISGVALLIWVAMLIPWPPRWRRWGHIGMFLLLAGILLYGQLRPPFTRQPVSLPVNFQDQVHLLAYDLPSTRYQPGETVELQLYWFAQQTPPANYKIFFHLSELDDSGKVAQVDSEPTFGYAPMSTWEPGELFVDTQRLPLPDAIKPGRYKLLMGVYHPESVQNLTVRSAPQALPGDRVVITEVEIVHD